VIAEGGDKMVFVPTEKKTANGVTTATKTANGDAEKVGTILYILRHRIKFRDRATQIGRK
jgi:hypothetical protein